MRSMLARLILVLLAAMVPPCALAQEREDIPGTRQTFGNWQLGGWKEGGRAGCTMSVNYRHGVEMSFTLEGEQWRVSWWHPNWRYADGQWIAVTLWVDQSAPRTVDAERVGGTRNPLLRAVLPDSPELFEQFRSGNQLFIRVQGGASYTFNLTATSPALAALRACAARNRGTEASPVTASGARRDGPVVYTLPALTPDQRVDVIRLAANLLSRMSGFRMLDDDEQKKLNKQVAGLQAAVVWRSENVHGLIHLFPDEKEENIPRLAGAMIGAGAQQCKERFTVTTEPDVRSASVRRILSNCTEGGAGVNLRTILMPVPGKSGVYLFLTEGTPKDEAVVQRADELLRNALFEVVKK